MQENATPENLLKEIYNLVLIGNQLKRAQIKLKYPLANGKIAEILNKY